MRHAHAARPGSGVGALAYPRHAEPGVGQGSRCAVALRGADHGDGQGGLQGVRDPVDDGDRWDAAASFQGQGGPFFLCRAVCHLGSLWTAVLRGPRTNSVRASVQSGRSAGTVGFSTDGHGRAVLAACSGLMYAGAVVWERFLLESLALSPLGGTVGLLIGGLATVGYSLSQAGRRRSRSPRWPAAWPGRWPTSTRRSAPASPPPRPSPHSDPRRPRSGWHAGTPGLLAR
jgi:hypothetical protein